MNDEHNVYRSQFFRLLLIFRWVSLVPPLLLVRQSNHFVLDWPPYFVLILAAVVNLVITIWSRPLNRLLRDQPWILSLELVYSGALLLITGGVDSPYYMLVLSPLLAGAFFFQVRGGLITGGIFSAIYLIGLYFLNTWQFSEGQLNWFILQLFGIGALPALVGAVSGMTLELRKTNDQFLHAQHSVEQQNVDLQATHTRLQTIHDLTLLLQAAPDVSSMQEQVLRILASSLKTKEALLGIAYPGELALRSWKSLKAGKLQNGDEMGFLATPVKLSGSPLLEEALQSRTPYLVAETRKRELPTELQGWAAKAEVIVLPLVFHEELVGVLFLQAEGAGSMKEEERTLMRTLANQAATSLGTTMLCVERARDLAVEQERNRIAREIHDTVSQSLFGMVYSIDACVRMLPDSEEKVKEELGEIQNLANLTRDQVRHSIFDLWPSSLTLEVFQNDLTQYVAHCFQQKPFDIRYDIEGDFDALSPAIRRNLYRITQEALSNAMNHAGATEARVVMAIDDEELTLLVIDEGVGFDVKNALGREYSREHFGLHGIQERVGAMRGKCEIKSEIDKGTQVMVQVPLKSRSG